MPARIGLKLNGWMMIGVEWLDDDGGFSIGLADLDSLHAQEQCKAREVARVGGKVESCSSWGSSSSHQHDRQNHCCHHLDH